jgi:hypothetical protein
MYFDLIPRNSYFFRQYFSWIHFFIQYSSLVKNFKNRFSLITFAQSRAKRYLYKQISGENPENKNPGKPGKRRKKEWKRTKKFTLAVQPPQAGVTRLVGTM